MNSLQSTAPAANTASEPNLHVLNAPDRLMCVCHQGLRALGHAGFSCQSHIWLDGRLDVDRLQASLARLARRHPVVTGRIVAASQASPSIYGGTAWIGGGGSAKVRVHTLRDNNESSVLHLAETLLAEPWDLDKVDPIAFHLLRRPSGRDVLILQWNHALMDGKAPELVLAELNRLTAATESEIDTELQIDRTVDAGEIAVVLQRHPRMRRFKAAARIVTSHIRMPVRSITLEPPSKPRWVFQPIRIAVRTLDTDATAQLSVRVRQLCGLHNLTPAILASVYRVIARLSPRPTTPRSIFRTDVPLNLRTPRATGPIFRNFMSFISLHATVGELSNRDELTRLLHRRMRDELARSADIGNLVMMNWMSRRPRMLHKHLLRRMQKYPLTLGFGFLGPLTAGLDNVLGVPIERFYTLNMAMSPPGMTLQANVCHGRLNLAATYIEAVVPDARADAFLDGVVEDLTSRESA